MTGIHNPADVQNPLAPDVSDYDWLEFVSFVWKVKQEGSYLYARDNYGPEFEAPEMQAIAGDKRKLHQFYDANKSAVIGWYDAVGGQAAVDLHNDHVDEQRKRAEDACLWGIRCTDGYVITCDTEQDRDRQVAYLNENLGKGWRVPAVLLSRTVPGGEWNETPLPA